MGDEDADGTIEIEGERPVRALPWLHKRQTCLMSGGSVLQ